MIFGRKRDTVATPSPDAAQPAPDTVATGQPPLALVRPPEPTLRDVIRAISELNDEITWQKERYEKLQNRVTTELREIRREVDRFYDAPEEER